MNTTDKPELEGHEVIVCTRNRPDDLRRALTSVAASSHSLSVLVVDSSDDERALQVVGEPPFLEAFGPRLRFLHSKPGLTLQRNVGLDDSQSAIVHFIDDDVEVFDDYFARVAQLFADPEVVGGGGVQNHIAPRRSNRLRRLGQIEAKPGRLSASGVNNLVTQHSELPVDVDWLSGCCMAFRTEAARRTRFNEDLVGYSLGEDVEFSLRIGEQGRLLIDTSARVHHHLSPVNRSKLRATIRDTFRHRRSLISAHPHRFSVEAFWWSIMVDSIRYGLGALLGRSASKQAILGVWDAARDPHGLASDEHGHRRQ